MAPRSRAQLHDALARRNVPEDVAERVLDRLTQVGLVDDVAYAQAWVRSRHAGKGLGRRALADELHNRGIDDEVTAGAVGALDPTEERETARKLAERKLASCRGLKVESRVRRAVGMLTRKGYPAGMALAVVRDALEAEGADAGAGGHLDMDFDDVGTDVDNDGSTDEVMGAAPGGTDAAS